MAERKREQSAGCLLYREGYAGLEVLLVHPSGWYNRNRPWSIPKGLPEDGEDLMAAARRETEEETGIEVCGPLAALGSASYKSGKVIHCFGAPAPSGAEARPASWEVDAAEFLAVDRASELIHEVQGVFIERLREYLAGVDSDEAAKPSPPSGTSARG